MSQAYQALLETSRKANWRIDDIIGAEWRLDFSKNFLPETFVRADALRGLSERERRLLNHIRSRGYLAMFELLEQVIVPFVSDLAIGAQDQSARAPALRNLVREENKHRELFRRVLKRFDDGFGVECALIGPAEAVVGAFLGHGAMGIIIAILALEWMSQDHYVESVRGDDTLDAQFKELLRRHWAEEAQHAALDELELRAMAAGCSPAEIDRAVDDFFDIGGIFDGGLKQQAALDLAAFEQAAGRRLSGDARAAFLRDQHQALRWTFLGTTMRNPNFLAVIGDLSPAARRRFEEAAPAFSIN